MARICSNGQKKLVWYQPVLSIWGTHASEYETVENWSEATCLHSAGKGLEHKDLQAL